MFCTCKNIQSTQNPYTITKGMRRVAFEPTQKMYLIGNTQMEQLQMTNQILGDLISKIPFP